jgi:hypothetical protein
MVVFCYTVALTAVIKAETLVIRLRPLLHFSFRLRIELHRMESTPRYASLRRVATQR